MNSFHLLRIKIRMNFTPVWNKLLLNHTFKIPPTQHFFGAEQIYFNDNFDKQTGTKLLLRGVGFAVIDPFSITFHNSPDKYIIHRIADKLTIYPLYVELVEVSIHEVQIYSFCMIFHMSIWRCMVSFDASSSADSLRVHFADFLPELSVYSQYPIIQVFQDVVNPQCFLLQCFNIGNIVLPHAH